MRLIGMTQPKGTIPRAMPERDAITISSFFWIRPMTNITTGGIRASIKYITLPKYAEGPIPENLDFLSAKIKATAERLIMTNTMRAAMGLMSSFKAFSMFVRLSAAPARIISSKMPVTIDAIKIVKP